MNGGTSTGNNPTEFTLEDTNVELSKPVKDGSSFVGWKLSEDSSTITSFLNTNKAGDVTLYAIWEPKTYYITYKLDGGVNNPSNLTRYKSNYAEFQLGEPSRENYTFLGWYLDKEFTQQITSVRGDRQENLTVYAKWQLNQGVGVSEDGRLYVKPEVPVIKSVKNKKGCKLVIKSSCRDTNLQIKISTKKKFTKKTTKTYYTYERSFTVKKMTKGKKYYVKLRSYRVVNGKKIYSDWSRVVKVKIKK